MGLVLGLGIVGVLEFEVSVGLGIVGSMDGYSWDMVLGLAARDEGVKRRQGC